VDIFRLLSLINKENSLGTNNAFDTRDCYICLHMHAHKPEEEYPDPNIMIKKIYEQYGITFISSYVLKNYKINDYFPIETIFVLDKKEKIKI
jgi:hypothetical protein